MANENMIKFLRGNVADLPQTATAGALYFTKDEGIYLGMEDGSFHRYGDFITVADINSLPVAGAHETCMYYCTSENVLCRYDSVKGWVQINKQPTAEEMKTLLGLGGLAYKSEVAEADLNADLAAKINTVAEGNHSHDNKALLDTYTQTEADLADAVTKKHAHANADELAKIADGDKAKWDAVVADHLTSADKTTLEDAIKEAKKAGTDANTALEAYKVTNDAAIDAIEEDVAEIIDGTNGILAQAKAYADGKDSAIEAAKKAGDDAQDAIDAYIESNNTALAGVKATADAAAVKTEVETALAGKVDKVEGKSLIADSEITRLASVTNYDDTTVKADIAKKADAATMTTELGKKVDKVEGYSLVANDEIARLAEVDNYDDEEVRGLIGDNADAIAAINNADTGILKQAKDYADGKDNAIAAAKKAGDDAQADVDALETLVGTLPEGTDATTVIGYIDAKTANIASDETVGAIDDRVAAIEEDYLKDADKTELEGKITANANAIELLTNGVSAEEVDGVNDLIQYVKDHGTEVTGIKADIKANADAIAEHEELAAETYELKTDASAKLTEAKEYADGINTALDARLDVLEAIDHEAYIAADAELAEAIEAAKTDAANQDAVVLAEAQKYADQAEADAIAAAEGKVNALAGNVYTKAEVESLLTWGSF